MKTFSRILAVALALVLLLGTLVGCAVVRKPLFYLKKVLKNSIEESVGGELASFLFSSLSGGSVSVDFGGTDLAETVVDSATLTAWIDLENHRLALDGDVVIDGKEYIAAAWINQDDLVVKSPTLFGSTTLGLNFNNLEQDLKNSIFSNNSGTDYAKSEVSENTAKSVNDMKEGLFSLLSSAKDWLELSDEVLEVFLEQLGEQAYNNRYREHGRSYVSLSVNNDALSRALRETRAVLVKDRSFCREMRKLAQTKDAMESAKTGVITNTHSTELEYFLSSSSKIEDLCLKIDSAAPFVLTLDAQIKNAGDYLEKASLSFTENGVKRVDALLSLGEQGDPCTLSVMLDGVCRTFTYCIEKDNLRAYEADFSYVKTANEENELLLAGTLSINRKKDTFSLSYTVGGVERSFSGEYERNSKHLLFSVEEATLGNEQRYLELKIEVKRSDRIPEVPSYQNVITISSTAYAPIAERAQGVIAELRALESTEDLCASTALSKLFTALGLEAEIPALQGALLREQTGWWELFGF